MVYAVLTDAGLAKLREASESHLAQIDALFRARLDDEELAGLTMLLARLDEGDDSGLRAGREPCAEPESADAQIRLRDDP